MVGWWPWTTEGTDLHTIQIAYRHDARKLEGGSLSTADETFADVRVNQPVPFHAERDATALSRARGTNVPSDAAHTSNTRYSLVTEQWQTGYTESSQRDIDRELHNLLTEPDPVALHRNWLTSRYAASFPEAVSEPTTSLKYHTLLVAALLSHYSDDRAFPDLALHVDPPGTIVPHETVFAGPRFSLRIGRDDGHDQSARLGERPWQSWPSAWTRLPVHPLDVESNPHDRLLDANLRRLRAWSTALQYIADVESGEASE